MKNRLLLHKKYLLFFLIITIIGILSGIFYYNFLDSSLKENIMFTINNYNNFRYNAILKDLLIMSFLLVTSFFGLGVPLSIFYFFYEFLTFGFLIKIFFLAFGIKGIFYMVLYFVVNKLIFLIVMLFFIKKLINISRYIIGLIIYKKETSIKDKIIINFTNAIYLLIFTLLLNILLYFITPYIFTYLSFLL